MKSWIALLQPTYTSLTLHFEPMAMCIKDEHFAREKLMSQSPHNHCFFVKWSMQNVFSKGNLLVNRLLLLFRFVLLVGKAPKGALNKWASSTKRAWDQSHRNLEMDGTRERDQFSSLCEKNKMSLSPLSFSWSFKNVKALLFLLVNRSRFKQRRLLGKAQGRSAKLQRTELAWELRELSGKCYVWSRN